MICPRPPPPPPPPPHTQTDTAPLVYPSDGCETDWWTLRIKDCHNASSPTSLPPPPGPAHAVMYAQLQPATWEPCDVFLQISVRMAAGPGWTSEQMIGRHMFRESHNYTPLQKIT